MGLMGGYTDEDFRRTMLSAIRLLAVITVVALPLVWWKAGWASAALLLVGAVISGSGLYEWLRLMTAGDGADGWGCERRGRWGWF